MKVNGRVINDRNEFLPGATVAVVNAAGQSLNYGVIADENGYFEINSPLVDGNKLVATAAGHLPVTREPAALMVFELPVNELELETVYVEPGQKTGFLFLLAGFIIYKAIT